MPKVKKAKAIKIPKIEKARQKLALVVKEELKELKEDNEEEKKKKQELREKREQQRNVLQDERKDRGEPNVITLEWVTKNVPAKYLNPLIRWTNDDNFCWFSTDEFVLRAVEIARHHQPDYDWFDYHQIQFIFRSLLRDVAEIPEN